MIIIKDNDKFAIKSLILHNQNILQIFKIYDNIIVINNLP